MKDNNNWMWYVGGAIVVYLFVGLTPSAMELADEDFGSYTGCGGSIVQGNGNDFIDEDCGYYGLTCRENWLVDPTLNVCAIHPFFDPALSFWRTILTEEQRDKILGLE